MPAHFAIDRLSLKIAMQKYKKIFANQITHHNTWQIHKDEDGVTSQ